MSHDHLKTIAQPVTARFTDRGSRFIGIASPVMDSQEVEKKLSEIRLIHPNASHYCYAWRLDPHHLKEFSQDDGEPSGTAGLPILGVIKSGLFINVLIIVIRYYGGTKLGKSGLINAYKVTATECLAHADSREPGQFTPVLISYPYALENTLREWIHKYQMQTENETWLETVSMTLYPRSEDASALMNKLEQLAYLGVRFTILPECYRIINK